MPNVRSQHRVRSMTPRTHWDKTFAGRSTNQMVRHRIGGSGRGAKEKISVTVDRDVWAQARALPWAASASDVVNEALHRLVAAERLGVMLDQLAEDFGPVDEELISRAEARWFGE
jgi:hypothetical protein